MESGFEQRIAIDRIVMHDNYENYQHDVVLMRLSRPANIQRNALARKICLPFVSTGTGGGSSSASGSSETGDDIDVFDDSSNQLRKLQMRRNGAMQKIRRRNDKFVKERSSSFGDTGGLGDRKKYVTNFNQQWHFLSDKRTRPVVNVKSKVNVSNVRGVGCCVE